MNDEERRAWGFRPWAENGMTVAQAQQALEDLPGPLLNRTDRWGNPVSAAVTPPDPARDAREAARLHNEQMRARNREFADANRMPDVGPRAPSSLYVNEDEPPGWNAGGGGLTRNGYQLTDEDWNLVHRVALAEAGIHTEAYAPVIYSILNRIGTSEGGDAYDVIYGRPDKHGNRIGRPFSSVYPDANGKLNELFSQSADPSSMSRANQVRYNQVGDVIAGIRAGEIPDTTRGGTFFYSSNNGVPPTPSRKDNYGNVWLGKVEDGFFGGTLLSGRLVPTLTVGNTVFLKDTKERPMAPKAVPQR